MAEVQERTQIHRVDCTGYVELWSVDKPYLIRVEPLR